MLDEMAGSGDGQPGAGAGVAIEGPMRADGVEGPVRPWDWALLRGAGDLAATYDVDTARCGRGSSCSGCSTTACSSRPRSSTASRSRERDDLPAYAEDVRVFEVCDGDRPDARCSGCSSATGSRGPPSAAAPGWTSSWASRGCSARSPVVVVCLNVPPPGAGSAGADDGRRGAHRLPRVRARPARAVLRRRRTRGSPAPRCPATSSSSPPRSTRCGPGTPRCSPATPATTTPGEPLPQDVARPAGRVRRRRPGLRHGRDARRRAARPGVAPRAPEAPPCPPPRSRASRRRAGRGTACAPTWCRRATAAATSRTRSPTGTTPATTPTSGARCSTPTWSAGSPRTAG